MRFDNPIIFKNESGQFQLLDDNQHTLETKTAERGLRIFEPYFEDSNNKIFKKI